MSALRRLLISLLLVVASLTTLYAAKVFVMPRAQQAATYPAHDAHPQEKLTVAADPYDTRDKEKETLVGTYLEHSLLPVFVVISNDSDEPVPLTDMHFELVTRDRAKAPAVNDADLYRRFTNAKRYQDKSAGTKRLPLPIPLPSGDKGAVKKELRAEFEAARFRALAVEPRGTQSGFIFFDIGDLEDPARGASINVTGIKDHNGQPLMFFEISLDKYVNAANSK
jgi:hypothetical protein